jgi:hypothetical protein
MSDTSTLGIKEAFEVYSKHRDVIVQMWSFYSAGTLAILGYTIGSEKATRGWPEIGALLLGYAVFAVGNAWAVVSSQRELQAMACGIALLLENDPLAPYFAVNPIEASHFIAFYAAVSTGVCLAIIIKSKFGSKTERCTWS